MADGVGCWTGGQQLGLWDCGHWQWVAGGGVGHMKVCLMAGHLRIEVNHWLAVYGCHEDERGVAELGGVCLQR